MFCATLAVLCIFSAFDSKSMEYKEQESSVLSPDAKSRLNALFQDTEKKRLLTERRIMRGEEEWSLISKLRGTPRSQEEVLFLLDVADCAIHGEPRDYEALWQVFIVASFGGLDEKIGRYAEAVIVLPKPAVIDDEHTMALMSALGFLGKLGSPSSIALLRKCSDKHFWERQGFETASFGNFGDNTIVGMLDCTFSAIARLSSKYAMPMLSAAKKEFENDISKGEESAEDEKKLVVVIDQLVEEVARRDKGLSPKYDCLY